MSKLKIRFKFLAAGPFAAIVSVAAIAALLVILKQCVMPGIVATDSYMGSDSEWHVAKSVYPRLLNYSNAFVHPAMGVLASAVRLLGGFFDISVLSAWNVVLCLSAGIYGGGVVYISLRLGLSLLQSGLLGLGCVLGGSSVAWSHVPESHVMSAAGLVFAASVYIRFPVELQSSWHGRRPWGILSLVLLAFASGMMTISYSMLIGISAIPPLWRLIADRSGWRQGAGLCATVVLVVLSTLAMFGLAHQLGYLVNGRPIGYARFFDGVIQGGAASYLGRDVSEWYRGLSVLSPIVPAPDFFLRGGTLGASGVATICFGGVTLLVCAAALRRSDSRAFPIIAFAIFGALFHMIFAPNEAYLFSPAYGWAAISSIGLFAKLTLPRYCTAILASFALCCGSLNAVGFSAWATRLSEEGNLLSIEETRPSSREARLQTMSALEKDLRLLEDGDR